MSERSDLSSDLLTTNKRGSARKQAQVSLRGAAVTAAKPPLPFLESSPLAATKGLCVGGSGLHGEPYTYALGVRSELPKELSRAKIPTNPPGSVQWRPDAGRGDVCGKEVMETWIESVHIVVSTHYFLKK